MSTRILGRHTAPSFHIYFLLPASRMAVPRDPSTDPKMPTQALDQDDRPTHLAAAITIQGCMRGRLFRVVASSMRTENGGILREYADKSAPEPASQKKKKKAKPKKNEVDNPLAYANPTWSESEVEFSRSSLT